MRKNPAKRLGSSERDAEDVKKQAFFRVRDDLFLPYFYFFLHITIIIMQQQHTTEQPLLGSVFLV